MFILRASIVETFMRAFVKTLDEARVVLYLS